MNVMVLLLFIGVVLVTLAVGFFIWNVASGTMQHVDRLALLPLGQDTGPAIAGTDHEQAEHVMAAPGNSREGSR